VTWKNQSVKTEVVKSVGRVLEVLELFQRRRKPIKANQVCLELGYPKSSSNALLKSMVELGYLSFDSETLEYFPTIRVHGLGEWLPSALLGDERTNLLHEICDRTGETVTLSIRNGFNMQFVSVIPGKFPISLAVQDGFMAPILGTAVGIAYLSTLNKSQLGKVLDRAQRAGAVLAAKVTLEEVQQDILATKKRGYALGYDRVIPDTGAIAMVLPDESGLSTQIIGVGGFSSRIRRAEKDLIQTMKSLVHAP